MSLSDSPDWDRYLDRVALLSDLMPERMVIPVPLEDSWGVGFYEVLYSVNSGRRNGHRLIGLARYGTTFEKALWLCSLLEVRDGAPSIRESAPEAELQKLVDFALKLKSQDPKCPIGAHR